MVLRQLIACINNILGMNNMGNNLFSMHQMNGIGTIANNTSKSDCNGTNDIKSSVDNVNVNVNGTNSINNTNKIIIDKNLVQTMIL